METTVIGAIAGDAVGAPWEGTLEVPGGWPLIGERCRVTDDTVLALAVAAAWEDPTQLSSEMKRLWRAHPERRYGAGFEAWARGRAPGGQSLGAGAATRAIAVGWLAENAEEASARTRSAGAVTHARDAVLAAEAVAVTVLRARRGWLVEDIEAWLQAIPFELIHDTEPIGSFATDLVPRALAIGLRAGSWEEAVRDAVSRGGDTDTSAFIAGGVAEARGLEVPDSIGLWARGLLPGDLQAVFDRVMGR